ncbi:hypothetical protein PH488_17945, partial [Erysipelatoclostridium ramosum]
MNSKAFLSEGFVISSRFQRELPSAIAGVVRHIGETAQAFAGDAVVDALGEHPVLHHAHAAAGMEPHAFALARVLHAAVDDAVGQLVAFHEDLVDVRGRLAAQRERAGQTLDAGALQ